MANRDFEINMRMKADFASAQRELQKTQGDIERISAATAEANAEMSAMGSGSAGAAQAPAAADTGALDAQNAALDRNVQARESVARASHLTQEAIAAEMGLITDLHQRLDTGARSFDDLADTEAKLDSAMSKGLITVEEYDGALEQLNKEQERLTRESEKTGRAVDTAVGRYDKASAGLRRLAQDEAKLKDAVDTGRISREQYNRAMTGIGSERVRLTALREGANQAAGAMRTLNVQSLAVQRNLSQLVTYAVTGNLQMAGNQIIQLGNQAGIAGRLFSVAGLAIGGTAAVIGALGFAAVKGYLELRAFDTALIASGHSAGVTAGEIGSMGDRIGTATGKFGDADKALTLLVQSGKATGETLELMATAAINLSKLTGRSIEDTVRDIQSLAKAPTAGLIELNDRYNFLTLEIYENVRSLEEQGRTQEATKLATEELARVTSERTAEMREQLGTLERKWHDVRAALAGYLNTLKQIGTPDFKLGLAQIELERSQQVLSNLRASGASAERIEGVTRRVAQAQGRVNDLLGVEQQRRQDASDTAAESATQTEGLKAGEKVNALLKEGRSRAEQFSSAVSDLEAQFRAIRKANPDDARLADVIFGTDGLSGGAFDKGLETLRSRFKEPAGRKGRAGPKAEDPNKDALREIANLERQLGLLDVLVDGQERLSEAQRIGYEISEGAYKGASEVVKQQLVDNAQMLDQERAKVEINKELESVNLQTLQLQGKGAAAAITEAIDKLDELKQSMLNAGDDRVGHVDDLIGLVQAKAQLDQFEAQYQLVMGDIEREQQRIQLLVETGLLSEFEAQQRIVDLYREKGVVLGQLLPQMEAMAQTLGDPQAIANVQRIRGELEKMQATTNLLQQQVGQTFQGAFANALQSLATNTASLGEAVNGFLLGMADGLAQMASQALSQKAWAGLLGLFNQGADAAGAATETAAAAATTAAASALGVAATAVNTGAGAVGTSAGALGVAASALPAGAAAISAAAIQLQAAATTMLAANAASTAGGFASGGFASGGYTGAGAKYDLAGYVHRGEYVMPKETVSRYGLGVMRALHHGALPIDRFANVGMPNTGVSAAPRYSFASGGLADASLPQQSVTIRPVVAIGENELAEAMNSAAGDRVLVAQARRLKGSLKQILEM